MVQQLLSHSRRAEMKDLYLTPTLNNFLLDGPSEKHILWMFWPWMLFTLAIFAMDCIYKLAQYGDQLAESSIHPLSVE